MKTKIWGWSVWLFAMIVLLILGKKNILLLHPKMYITALFLIAAIILAVTFTKGRISSD